MERWMSKYPDRKFRDLRIVGTHHSACYEIDGRDVIKSSFSKLKWFAFCFRESSRRGRCQSRKIETQLRMGVGYFDTCGNTNGKIYVAHSCRDLSWESFSPSFSLFTTNKKTPAARFPFFVSSGRTEQGNNGLWEHRRHFEMCLWTIELELISRIFGSFHKISSRTSKKPIIVIWTHGTTIDLFFLCTKTTTHSSQDSIGTYWDSDTMYHDTSIIGYVRMM